MKYCLVFAQVALLLLVSCCIAGPVAVTGTVPPYADLPEAARKLIEERATECVLIGSDMWSIRVKKIGEDLELKKSSADVLAPYKDMDAPRYVRIRDGYRAKTLDEAQSVSSTANMLKAQVRQVAWGNIYINVAKDGEEESIAIIERPSDRILDAASIRLRDSKGQPYWSEFPVTEAEGRQILYANRRRHGRVFKWAAPELKQATTTDVYNLLVAGPADFPNLKPEKRVKEVSIEGTETGAQTVRGAKGGESAALLAQQNGKVPTKKIEYYEWVNQPFKMGLAKIPTTNPASK